MTSDNETPLCSKSDLIQIAGEFHSLYMAHKEPLIQLILKWYEEHRKTTWPSPPPRLFPLPHRDLSSAEKAACLAAIHDRVWRGDPINPFPTDEFISQLDYLQKYEEARDFDRLKKHVSEIPASDLWFLNRHLDSVKNAMVPERTKERYPNRNDLWCRWAEEDGRTDADIRDRWNEMPEEERKGVDPEGWSQIADGTSGADVVKQIRRKRKVKRKRPNN
jgi:hypothetical protein